MYRHAIPRQRFDPLDLLRSPRARRGGARATRGRAGRADAAQCLLRSDARAVPGAERRLRQVLEGQDRPDRHRAAVARRLGQAGALGDRRPRGRRRHAGPGL